jgi:hypothetical protein
MSNNNFLTEASMILDYGYGATPKMNENAYDDRIAQDANEDDQFMNQIEEPEATAEPDETADLLAKAAELSEVAQTLIEVKPEQVKAMGEEGARKIFALAYLGSECNAIEQAYSDFMNADVTVEVKESTDNMDYLASRMLREPGMLEDEE